MEFWGVEVKSGQPLNVILGEDKVIHLSQANLGEVKNNKPTEPVYLHINIEGKKLVLGTLNSEILPQQIFDLVIDKDFQLSHSWKNGSVYFYGYKADQPYDESSSSDSDESDSSDEDDIPLQVANGKQKVKKEKKEDNPVVVKQEAKKEEISVEAKKKDGKQKVKIVEPQKDSDEDDSSSDDSDSDGSSEGLDSDKGDDDSSDSEDESSSEEEEETPQKQQSGKKRPNESAMKTPASEKKAKLSTPQKTDGKKAGGHVATPHPSKQAKTPANKSNQKSPASASTDGAHSCKPCNRNFKSDSALQSHKQAKHK